MNYEELTERLIVHFAGESFATDVAAAKKAFFDEAGIMDEENAAFEMRMTQFLEWYLFARPLAGGPLTPAQVALQAEDFPIAEGERPFFENLANSRHSLFEFVKIRGDDIYVRDLFHSKKIVIRGSPIRIGFSREEIFDARLIPTGEEFSFSRAFCFHPEDAAKYIHSEVKKARKSPPAEQEALMLRLLKMRYKYEQYRHLKLDYVYTNEKKVRF
jgi:hypothetical protein